MFVFDKKSLAILLILIGMVYISGAVFIDVMAVDSAQYATIAMEMRETGNYLQVQHHHADYLDKPPLLFWLSALSYSIFGLSPFAFRLPSLLFTLLGVYSTYRLGKLYYNRETGLLAALFLATCQGWFLFNHDVRTDTMLAGAVIFGVWQLLEYLKFKRLVNFMLAFTGIALAMLAKGPVGLVVPILAVGGEVVYKRQWHNVFRWEWMAGILIIILILSPMLWGLYKQFGREGPGFFFWTQSFGRITGESSWKDNTGYLYFTHVFLWAFMPWMVIALYALIKQVIKLFKPGNTVEIFSLMGFVLPVAALSLSHFKLPHYIFVAFPFTAILAAQGFMSTRVNGPARKSLFFFHIFMNLLLWGGISYICLVAFPVKNILIILTGSGLFLLSVLAYICKKNIPYPVLLPTFLTIIGINFLLNTHFYPKLLQYQSGSRAGEYVLENGIPPDRLYSFAGIDFTLDFRMKKIVPVVHSVQEIRSFLESQDRIWLFSDDKNLEQLEAAFNEVHVIASFDHFHVTLLSANFLNPKTRPKTLRKTYIVELEK